MVNIDRRLTNVNDNLKVGDFVQNRYEDDEFGIVVTDGFNLNVLIMDTDYSLYYRSDVERIDGQLELDFKLLRHSYGYDLDITYRDIEEKL